jgi:hypothetical protein
LLYTEAKRLSPVPVGVSSEMEEKTQESWQDYIAPIEEVRKGAGGWGPGQFTASGVYFLFLFDELVYVGKATCMWQRVDRHAEDKLWTCYTFTEIDDAAIRAQVEAWYINEYSPIYNYEPERRHLPPGVKIKKHSGPSITVKVGNHWGYVQGVHKYLNEKYKERIAKQCY